MSTTFEFEKLTKEWIETTFVHDTTSDRIIRPAGTTNSGLVVQFYITSKQKGNPQSDSLYQIRVDDISGAIQMLSIWSETKVAYTFATSHGNDIEFVVGDDGSCLMIAKNMNGGKVSYSKVSIRTIITFLKLLEIVMFPGMIRR